MNPRNSLRKMVGLYEHEINGWLEAALGRVTRVVDVGANDGYFTFGCAAAFRRFGKSGEIIAFEPEARHFATLERSIHEQTKSTVPITLVQKLVGGETKPGMTKLDAITWTVGDTNDRTNTLLKIDVEGAEEEVLAGGSTWLNSSNCFLIEVHKQPYLESITRLFADKGLMLDRVDQQPLWMIGREVRDKENWWLVSHLDFVRYGRADAEICKTTFSALCGRCDDSRTLYLRSSVHSGWRETIVDMLPTWRAGALCGAACASPPRLAGVLDHRHVGTARQLASQVEAQPRGAVPSRVGGRKGARV